MKFERVKKTKMVRISYIKGIKLFYQETFNITSFKDLKTTWVYERKTDMVSYNGYQISTFPEFVVKFKWYQF